MAYISHSSQRTLSTLSQSLRPVSLSGAVAAFCFVCAIGFAGAVVAGAF